MALEVTQVIDIVNNAAFPIAAFVMIYYQSTTTIKENTKAIRELVLEIRMKRKDEL